MKLGIKVKDKITGFTGYVTAYTKYITGCNQALVQAEMEEGKPGVYPESAWIDEQRLERVGRDTITLDNEKGPGFGPPAPKR